MDGDVSDGRGVSTVCEWEEGLPSAAELTPLSQCLISPQLASAFSIVSDFAPYPTSLDVKQASHSIFNILRYTPSGDATFDVTPPYNAIQPDVKLHNPHEATNLSTGGLHQEEARSDMHVDDEDIASAQSEHPNDDTSVRMQKKPRLVWTPELHKRFIQAVSYLGINNAVPKSIMQLMNVEGLTRENVASHLQKYRLYLKRVQGHSADGFSSDHIFASGPLALSAGTAHNAMKGIPQVHSHGAGRSHMEPYPSCHAFLRSP